MLTRSLTILTVAIGLVVAAEAAAASADCEATDINGDPRQCTHWEEFTACRDAAQDSYLQCRDAGGSYFRCDFFRGVSMFACDTQFVAGFALG